MKTQSSDEITGHDESAGHVSAARRGPGGRGLLSQAKSYSIVLVLVLLAVGGSAVSPGFLQLQSLMTMLSAIAPMAIVAVGMTFVIVAGGLDVSVGSVFALAGVAYAAVSNSTGSLAVAAIAAIGVGACAGLVNGLVITRLRLNPFIVTLGTAAVFVGILNVATKSAAVYAEHPMFAELGLGSLGDVPYVVWLLGVVLAGGIIVLGHTTYGRTIYAVGDSAEACRLIGIRVGLVRVSTYVLVGACAGLGGLVFASQSGVGLSTVGMEVPLLSIAAVVVGGTSLTGGRGAMWRTGVGIGIFAMINSLFIELALNGAAQSLVLGGVIVTALILDRLQNASP